LRGFKKLGHPRKLAEFDDFVRHLYLRQLTRRVIGIAADLYVALWKRGEPLEDADILIAATALAHNLVLVTDNERHFLRIPGLDVENWLREPWPFHSSNRPVTESILNNNPVGLRHCFEHPSNIGITSNHL